MECTLFRQKLLLLIALSSLPFVPALGEDAGVSWPVPSALFHIGNLNGANGLWKNAFEEASQRWNDAPTRFSFEVSREPGNGYCTSQGDNNVRFSSTHCGDAWGSSVLGVTAYWSNGTQLTKADISFDNAKDWDVYDGNMRLHANDFRRVAMHEMGHASGLAHPAAENVLMSTSANNTYLPALDDVNALQKKYGSTTHTLTIKNIGGGFVNLTPRVPGTGVVSENTFHTSNYANFLNCYAAQCQIPIQHGLRLDMIAVPAEGAEFINWEGTTIRDSEVALGAFTVDRTLIANFSFTGTTGTGTDTPLESGQASVSQPVMTDKAKSSTNSAGSLSIPVLYGLLLLAWMKTGGLLVRLAHPTRYVNCIIGCAMRTKA